MARMSATPPVAMASSPPPIIGSISAIIAIAVVVGLSLLCSRNPTALFLFKSVAFTVLLILTPSFAKWIADLASGRGHEDDLEDEKHRLIRVSLELLIFVTLIYGFTFWVRGQRLSCRWTGYTALLILLIEAGSHVIEWFKRRILKRVANTQMLAASAGNLRSMTKREPLLYAAVPLGIMAAAIIGAIWRFSGERTLSLMLILILISASMGLIFFLVLSLLRMVSPIFVEADIAQVTADSNSGVVQQVIVQVPATRKAKKDQRARDLSLLVVISDLRKVYLYSSLHNVVLLAVFAALIAKSTGIQFGIKWWLVSAAVLTFLFAQLPYVIGQKLMHDRVLRRFEGTELIDMKAELKKYAPAMPKSEFVAALVMSNTAGGFLFFLFDAFLKQQTQ